MASARGNTIGLDVAPIVVASHPRSGTHLVIDTLRRQFAECRSWKLPGEPHDRLYLDLDALTRVDGAMPTTTARRILGRARRPLLKTHCLPGFRAWTATAAQRDLAVEWAQWLDARATVLYVHRDGRDVMCSYHLLLKSVSEAARCPVGEFMRQQANGTSRARAWAEHVRRWLEQPQVHVLRFDDLTKDTRRVLTTLGSLVGATPLYREPLLPPQFRSVWESRRARLLSVHPDSTAILSKYRHGALERWRDAFTPADREFFHAEAGEMLIRLGYETSDAWVRSGR
ncbi:MAG: sulfotransferase domain-containing protein [Candidatus Binatia bacterium]